MVWQDGMDRYFGLEFGEYLLEGLAAFRRGLAQQRFHFGARGGAANGLVRQGMVMPEEPVGGLIAIAAQNLKIRVGQWLRQLCAQSFQVGGCQLVWAWR